MFLQTFGGLRLLDAAGQECRYPRKGLFLLAYLATGTSAEISRSEAADLLWGSEERALAFTNLRKLISRLPVAYASMLTIAPGHLRLDRRQLRCDAEAIKSADTSLSSLVELMSRPFLCEFDDAGGAASRWVKAQRRIYLNVMRQKLLEWSAEVPASADAPAARQAAFLILEHWPGDQLIRRTLSTGPPPQPSEGQIEPLFAVTAQPDALETLPAFGMSPRVALLPPSGGLSSALDLSRASALIDDVAIGLCSLRNLSIIAPYTAERIRNSDDKALMLGKHDISYVVDTKLTEDGLFVQIIFVPSDHVIYAERFDIAGLLLSSHRKTLAGVVKDRILAELKRNESAHDDYTVKPDAYRRYLFGIQQMSRLTLPSVRSARKSFREALQHNSDFSHAFSGLAKTYSIEWVLTARGDPELLRRAEENARSAIESNPDIAYGYKELGMAKLYLGALDESLEALARAEELSPHYADAIYSFADVLIHASRPKEGLEKIEHAISLNPLGPDEYFWCAAGASYFVGAFDKAVSRIDSMSNQASAHRLLAASWAMLGDIKRAHHFRRQDREANPQFDLQKWLAVVPIKEAWQKDMYREGLMKAGY
ncbi:hypothetical protein [Pararhizobium qamdonense]|uniref:hypothetical protein n=1 Tax=Pararhizobium qamdonense TaxID=3031126 RepID=UPI0023E0A122|nr:hypothetical protein [Pararhizobium qamdonense]